MREKARILDKEAIRRIITRLAHEILERNKNIDNLALIGIRTRGAYLAMRIKTLIEEAEKKPLELGILDITLYRDDLTLISSQPIVHQTEINFDIYGKDIILVDDVLYTGRTVRAGLDALIDFGRPRTIQLAVLVDRGHRELPIRADYVGKNIPTSQREIVEVRLKEIDEEDAVLILEKE